jgi:3-dehydroquinate dehydratase
MSKSLIKAPTYKPAKFYGHKTVEAVRAEMDAAEERRRQNELRQAAHEAEVARLLGERDRSRAKSADDKLHAAAMDPERTEKQP